MSDKDAAASTGEEKIAEQKQAPDEIKVEVEEQQPDAQAQPRRGPSREELIQALDKSREEAKALRDRMLRALAEADNQRKRLAREREEIIKFGQEKLMRDLLVPLDNLERSLSHIPAKAADANVAALQDGVALVLRQLQDVLAGYGLRGFSALGQPFDPNLHEAVDKVEDPSRPPDTVVAEISKGYMLHDRLLRPALVAVAVAPAEKGEAAAGAESKPQEENS